MSFWRRSGKPAPLPPQVREGLGLRRGEHVLAHGELAQGGWAIATTAALVLVDPIDGPVPGPGTPSAQWWWHDVAEAAWDPEGRAVSLRWADGSADCVLRLAEGEGRLPEVLRERVMSTFVLSQRLPVRGRRGVTVAVRRHAGDGSLFTQAVPDDGISTARPQVAEQVEALTRDLAAQAGLAG